MTIPKRTGIAAAGNWIIDHVKILDTYPRQDTLANILEMRSGNGGAAYNVLKDLAKLGAQFPLEALGLIGDDAEGRKILEDCKAHSIWTTQLKVTDKAPTSFTDVMTVKGTGRRTFFHHRGTNALFDIDSVNLDALNARIFHLGYLLLLDQFDKPSEQFGTKAAELLARAKRLGMKTSIDVVSEDSRRFADIVSPALKYTDYCILNEFETERVTGIATREGSRISREGLQNAAADLLERGVSDSVIIHYPEGGYVRSTGGFEHFQPSLALPGQFIIGTAGAGDAFCAGALYGLHEGWSMGQMMELGVCAAASSLSHSTCSDGVCDMKTVLKLADQFGFRELPVSPSPAG